MRSVPLPFLSKITLLWTRAREPGPVSPVKVDSPLPFPWTQRGEIYSRLSEVNRQIRLTGQYLGNKAVYVEYRKTKKSPDFYEAHRAEIALYESARDALREISSGEKLPSAKIAIPAPSARDLSTTFTH